MRVSTISSSYESGEQKVIPAVLIYAFWGTQVLLIKKTKPGLHLGKINGLGGKCERGESFKEAARREFYEESGIELDLNQFKPLGLLHFPNFKSELSEDWIVTVYVVDLNSHRNFCPEEIPQNIDEGRLMWVEEKTVLSLNLWSGDREFLPFVFSRTPFMGTLWYEPGGAVRRSEVQAW